MKNIILTLKNFIEEHYWAVICSFLLTILIFAPLLAFPSVIKDEYRGINITPFGTDAHFYLSRGKEVLDGHGLGNPVLREGKDQINPYYSYSDYLLLAPIKLLGLADNFNIAAIYNTYNIIGIFILIILIYFFVMQLSGNKLLAITAALSAVGGYSMVYHKALFYADFNTYGRILYPFVGSLGFFSYLNLLVKSLNSDKLKYKIYAGLALGLLFYLYFYAWSFTLAINASLSLVFLFKKNFLRLKKIILISVIGLALGSYNLINLFLSLLNESAEQFSFFMWMSHGRGPIFSKIGFMTLVLLAVYFYKRRDDKNLPFISALILAGWLALNQQIISGRVLQYGHYYFYFIVPLSIILSLYLVWRLLSKWNFRKYLFLAIIAVVFINTAGGQYKSMLAALEGKKYEQNFGPVIDYLNRDKAPGVILTDQPNAFLFTIYTSHDLFWQNIATVHQASIQRQKDALFVYYYLNKEARNYFKDYLEKIGENRIVKGSYYKLLFMNLEGYWSGYDFYDYLDKIASGDEEIKENRPKIIDELYKEYDETILKDNGINKILKKYGVNYIVWDKNNNPEWDLSGLEGFKQLFSYNNIYLFGLTK